MEVVRDTPKKEDECKNPKCEGGQVIVRGRKDADGAWEDGWFTEKCPLCLGTGKR